jgi:hypothetical protein
MASSGAGGGGSRKAPKRTAAAAAEPQKLYKIYVDDHGEDHYVDLPYIWKVKKAIFENVVDGGFMPKQMDRTRDWRQTMDQVAGISVDQLAKIIKLVPKKSAAQLAAILDDGTTDYDAEKAAAAAAAAAAGAGSKKTKRK